MEKLPKIVDYRYFKKIAKNGSYIDTIHFNLGRSDLLCFYY